MEQTHVITLIKEKISVEVLHETRLLDALKSAGIFTDAPCGGKGTCGKCKVRMQKDEKWETVQACQTKVLSDIFIDTSEHKREHQILTSADTRKVEFKPGISIVEGTQGYMAAVDIGTTTIASYLLDGRNGRQICTASCLNPQTAYGADVISRAEYTLKYGSAELTKCIQDAVNSLLLELSQKAGADIKEIRQICLVGNTCMHHIFFGLPMDSLVLAPYEPYEKKMVRGKASDFNIQIHPEGELIFLPVIAGFVGADTMGCLLAIRPDLEEKMSLIIDIGTNGELVLGNKEKMVCCSTAAGPAFEGAKIECGMRGAQGAVDHIFYSEGSFHVSVIGGGRPKGLCGSGLIDVTACLRKMGLMDEAGRLLGKEETEKLYGKEIAGHIVERDGRNAFVFCTDTPSVFLTQKDIGEVQLAKGAIAAGIFLLEKYLGITHEQVDRVYIAGAFGNYMDTDNACDIGLLPQSLRKRIVSIGNAAGEGAKIALKNSGELELTETLRSQINFLELASMAEFQDCFIDELEFPEL